MNLEGGKLRPFGGSMFETLFLGENSKQSELRELVALAI
jgi:hypothetical protein